MYTPYTAYATPQTTPVVAGWKDTMTVPNHCHDSSYPSYPILSGDDGDLGNEHSHGSLLEAHGGERCDQHRCPGTPQRGAQNRQRGRFLGQWGRGEACGGFWPKGKPVETEQLTRFMGNISYILSKYCT